MTIDSIVVILRLPLVVAVMSVVEDATVAQTAEPAPTAPPGLTIAGWVLMISSLSFVWGLAIWCYRRALSIKEPVDPGPAARP